jgi:DNA polymerase III alpha subunit (gram-positive type)
MAGTHLYNALQKWYNLSRGKIIPVGHNVAFDIRKITNSLISKGSWDNFISYRVLDTCTIAQYLILSGKLNSDISCSLGHLSAYFKINIQGNAHEAKYDTLITMAVLQELMKI